MKKRIIKSTVLGALFIVLHFYVYTYVQTDNYNFQADQPHFRDFFTISEPIEYSKLEVKEEVHPDYLAPFRKPEYRYSEKDGVEIVLTTRELADYSRSVLWDFCSIFLDGGPPVPRCIYNFGLKKSDYWQQVILGDEMKYYDNETDCCFNSGAPFGGKHANRLFFLVQYVLLFALIYQMYRILKLSQK